MTKCGLLPRDGKKHTCMFLFFFFLIERTQVVVFFQSMMLSAANLKQTQSTFRKQLIE